MHGCVRATAMRLNQKFVGALKQLHNRHLSYAEGAYVMQAVLFARLRYAMSVAIPSSDLIKRWQTMSNRMLQKSLRSIGISHAVFSAARSAGGMGGKTLLQIRDECVLTLVMSVLNTDTVVAKQLRMALAECEGEAVHGLPVNDPHPTGLETYAGRLRRVLADNDMLIDVRSARRKILPPGQTPRELLGLGYGQEGHLRLKQARVLEIRDVFSCVDRRWKLNESTTRGAGLTAARERLAERRGKRWFLRDDAKAPDGTLLAGYVAAPSRVVEGTEGGLCVVSPNLGWVPRGFGEKAHPEWCPAEDFVWYTDGSFKKDGEEQWVGWATVRDKGGKPDLGGFWNEMGPLGRVGMARPTNNTAELTALNKSVERTPMNATSCEINTDSKSCTTTHAKLRFLTPRAWTRLSTRHEWRLSEALRATRALAARRMAARRTMTRNSSLKRRGTKTLSFVCGSETQTPRRK